ncbi:MAG: Asp-tRNA(Asn)/Glu-tRNA(Gln) amidotransferase subunit GatA, partial [Bacilli bacterium]|nr:Asp-tRNA(Asn)/Glu-tRNA(Gln) amidotransferase subunit GatA [Bacilli bacterium]
DASIITEALSGRDEHDSTSSFREVESYMPTSIDGLKGKRIAIIKEIVDSLKNEEVKKLFLASTDAMKKAGAIVEEVEFGTDALESIYATYIVISCAEATSNDANLDGIKFGPYYEGKSYQEVMYNARTKGFSELIKRRFVIGSFALMRENQDVLFLRAQRNRAKIVAKANEILRDYDAFIAPSAPGIAPLFEGSSDKLSDEYLIADNHMAIGNFGGFPSITLPMGFVEEMPVGINFTSAPWSEKKILDISKAYEDITGLKGLSVNNRKGGNLQ